ncbi:MAG TPA: glucose-6-phosphate dehydrogenase, partial [Candidatus Paceibacterota bacterium]
KFSIVGFSRRSFTREEFREYIRGHIKVKPGQYHEEDIKHFLDHMYYEQGLFDSTPSYANLSLRLNLIDDSFGQCSNKLFHLAVAPHFYETILEYLSRSGLTIPCSDGEGWTRVLVEKPFGNDIEGARSLDKKLGKLFKEEQIFRIDHYLAKEALQNILSFRFSNTLFEPLWNSKYIDAVHIKLLEKNEMEGRGEFYDKLGALKDVGQNHILQMLALVAMERPENLDALSIRKERAKIINKIEQIDPKKMLENIVRSQYNGYTQEKGVKANSNTETYFRIETYIDSQRWKDILFYLESGKAQKENKSEIDIYFKNDIKGDRDDNPDNQNILTFRIQPDEGIKIRFFVKTPGFNMEVEPKTLKFKYSDS